MSPGIQIVLSGSLTFGIPLALAIRDLWTLRRPNGGGWQPEPPQPVHPRPNNGGSPARPALPACLLEAARGRPLAPGVRELERV